MDSKIKRYAKKITVEYSNNKYDIVSAELVYFNGDVEDVNIGDIFYSLDDGFSGISLKAVEIEDLSFHNGRVYVNVDKEKIKGRYGFHSSVVDNYYDNMAVSIETLYKFKSQALNKIKEVKELELKRLELQADKTRAELEKYV